MDDACRCTFGPQDQHCAALKQDELCQCIVAALFVVQRTAVQVLNLGMQCQMLKQLLQEAALPAVACCKCRTLPLVAAYMPQLQWGFSFNNVQMLWCH